MSKQNPANPYVSYEVITQVDDSNDDLLIPIPPALLEKMGWKEGDDVDFSVDDQGRIIMKRIG
jgi:antitoxin component of MazEF toxin-antitoxin module